MADEQDIKIKIGTEADVSGAKKAEDALKGVEQQAKNTEAATGGGFTPTPMGPPRDEAAEAAEASEKALAEAMQATSIAHEKLLQDTRNADVARARSAQASREQAAAEAVVAQSIQQTASATRQLNFQLGAMAAGQLAQGIGQVNQELGGILASTAQGAAVAGPWGAAIGALVGSLTAVIDAQKQYNKVVEETEAKIKANSLAVEQHSQKVNELRLKDSYQEQWSELETVIDTVNQALRDNLELENARRAASESLGSATREAEEASIRALRQTGAISAQQEAAQLAELRQQEAEANKQAAIADAQAQQAQRQVAIDQAKRSLELFETQRDIAQRDLQKAREEFDRIQAGPQSATSDERRGEVQAQITSAEKVLEGATSQVSAASNKVIEAQNALQAGVKLLELEVSKIGAEFDAQGLADKAKEVGDKTKEEAQKAAAEVRSAIDAIIPQNRLQEESLTQLKQAISDGELSKQEAAAAVQQLSNMNGNLNTELGKILGVVTQFQRDQSARDQVLQRIISDQQAQQLQIIQLLMK